MANQRIIEANLLNEAFPYNFRELANTVVQPAWEGDKKPRPTECFYMDNILPNERGYSSVNFRQVVPAIPDLEGEILTEFVIVNSDGNEALFCATSTTAYVFEANGVAWIEQELPVAALGDITYAPVKENTYIYVGFTLYTYNFSTHTLEEANINVTLSLLGICAAGEKLVGWDKDTIYWSSSFDPLDFDPVTGLETGAGSTKVLAIKGRIVACITMGQDFIIYTSKNAVSARQTGNISQPFVFKAIGGSAGIATINHVAYNTTNQIHVTWTASGFQEVNLQSAQYAWPELSEGLIKGIKSELDDFNIPVLTRTSGFDVKLKFCSNRWLLVSTRDVDSEDSSYEISYCFDVLLSRWGRLNLTHVGYVEFSITETITTYTYQQLADEYVIYGNIPSNIAYAQLSGIVTLDLQEGNNCFVLRNDGSGYIFSYSETQGFQGSQDLDGIADSRIFLGRYKMFSTSGMLLNNIKVKQLFDDATIRVYAHDYIGNFVDYKDITIENSHHPDQFFQRISADSVTFEFTGQFTLNQLAICGHNLGKRNQRYEYGNIESEFVMSSGVYPLEEASGCDIFTSDQYWQPFDAQYNYEWTGIEWYRNDDDSQFEFAFIPINGWQSGYRKPILNMTVGSGLDTGSGGVLFANDFDIYDTEGNIIGSQSVSFDSYEETKDITIILNYIGFDIDALVISSFLYGTGPIISNIEFCDATNIEYDRTSNTYFKEIGGGTSVWSGEYWEDAYDSGSTWLSIDMQPTDWHLDLADLNIHTLRLGLQSGNVFTSAYQLEVRMGEAGAALLDTIEITEANQNFEITIPADSQWFTIFGAFDLLFRVMNGTPVPTVGDTFRITEIVFIGYDLS